MDSKPSAEQYCFQLNPVRFNPEGGLLKQYASLLTFSFWHNLPGAEEEESENAAHGYIDIPFFTGEDPTRPLVVFCNAYEIYGRKVTRTDFTLVQATQSAALCVHDLSGDLWFFEMPDMAAVYTGSFQDDVYRPSIKDVKNSFYYFTKFMRNYMPSDYSVHRIYDLAKGTTSMGKGVVSLPTKKISKEFF